MLFTALLFLVSFHSTLFVGSPATHKVQNGLYLIEQCGNDSLPLPHPKKDQAIVNFSDKFLDSNKQEFTKFLINTIKFVPLDLSQPPDSVVQTDKRKRMLLSLKSDASQKLHRLTSENLGRRVALVIGGEAVTMHKIRAAITDGKLQISRCTDNACEYLLIELKKK